MLPPPTPSVKFTEKLSPKEWAALQRAVTRNPQLEPQCLGVDGKVGIPRGWKKMSAGGFVRGDGQGPDSGLTFAHINEVLDWELERL